MELSSLKISGFNLIAFLSMSVASILFFVGFDSPTWAEYDSEFIDSDVQYFTGVWRECIASNFRDLRGKLPFINITCQN